MTPGYDATPVRQTHNQRQTTGLRKEVTLLQRILGHFLDMDYSNNNYMDLINLSIPPGKTV